MLSFLIIKKIFKKASNFLKTTNNLFLIFLLAFLFLPFFVFSQTITFNPANLQIKKNTDFSLVLEIKSVNNFFGVGFDVDFDPSLLEYISVNEGNFLSQGCNTVFLVNSSSPGKIIVGLSRLGASCGGVSGSGVLATFNFRSKNQDAITSLSFSNTSICLLDGSVCNYIAGFWNPAIITIGNLDNIPPVISSANASSITQSSAVITWTTNEPSDSQVEYGQTISYGNQTVLNNSMTTSHSVTLSGLAANTTYHYRVKSRDAAGNLAVSNDYIFTTNRESESCPLNTKVYETSAILVGEVTEYGGDPNLEVWFDYRKSSDSYYNFQTPQMSKYGTGLFCYTVENLQTCTTYFYRAVAKNSSGISYGEEKFFTTPCSPSVDLKANYSDAPLNLPFGNNVTLSWSSQNADFCLASGDWSGEKAISGNEIIQLNTVKRYNFSLACFRQNSSLSNSDSVVIYVLAKPPIVITKPAVVTY